VGAKDEMGWEKAEDSSSSIPSFHHPLVPNPVPCHMLFEDHQGWVSVGMVRPISFQVT